MFSGLLDEWYVVNKQIKSSEVVLFRWDNRIANLHHLS